MSTEEAKIEASGDVRPHDPVRLLLVDGPTMFRQGLSTLLTAQGDIEVIAETPDGREAVRSTRRLSPDVVVVHAQPPFETFRQTVFEMLDISPRPKVVAVVMIKEPHNVRELLGLGLDAYLFMSATVDQLKDAIRSTVEDPSENKIMVGMPGELFKQDGRLPGNELSEREQEILLLVARGLGNGQIARTVHISEATVKRHLANIYPKLGVSSRWEATSKALSENLLTVQDVTRG